MPATQDDVLRQLMSIHESYATDLPRELERIQDTWRAMVREESTAGNACDQLVELVHRLAGSGATFGFPALSDAARVLLVVLTGLQRSAGPLTQEQRGQVEHLIAQLVEASQEPAGLARPHLPAEVVPRSAPQERPIFLVEDDVHLGAQLVRQLGQLGYQVELLSSAKALLNRLAQITPAVIVMDMALPEGALAGAEAVREFQHCEESDVPVVFISVRDDMIARLEALRAGANHYLVKPLDTRELACILDNLAERAPAEPYRVLVVDDDPHLADMYRFVLEQNGFVTQLLYDPMQVLPALKEFSPDLILLDVYMPECSGTEVAAVIRQFPENAVIPIVFLSTETDFDKQLAALDLGGDDFISKPVTPQHLVRIVRPRARRARVIGDLNRQLHKLAQELDEQRAALQCAHDELEERVRSRTEALRGAIRRLEQANAQRDRAQKELVEAKERAEVTLNCLGEGVISTDADHKVEYLNPAAESLTGWSAVEAVGQPLSAIFKIHYEADGTPALGPLQVCLEEDKPSNRCLSEVLLVSRDGREHAIQTTGAPLEDRQGKTLGAVLLFRDVTESRRLLSHISYQATHDSLTDLINRVEFERRIEQALASYRVDGSEHCLCYLDLDQFKIVNDTAGHEIGDQMLREIARLLSSQVRDRDTLARLGGDEFGLLLNNCSAEHAVAICESIISRLQDFRFVWEERTFQVGVSIGAAPIAAEADTPAQLLSRADVACYTAKEHGRNQVWTYQTEGDESSRQHGEIIRAAGLREAVTRNRFRLFLQPIQPLLEEFGSHRSYEVLLRMLDTDGKLLLPATFIAPAERFGLMLEIDRWVINSTFALYRDLAERFGNLVFNINLSGISLSDESLYEFVLDKCETHAVTPQAICFEVTETAAVRNLERASLLLTKLRRHGFAVALDDFGAGLSSFRYLKKLPADFLKIDGSFVRGMQDDPHDETMVKAIHGIGQSLALRTVAECVETEAMLDRVRKLGIDYAQGFAIGRPAPCETLLTS